MYADGRVLFPREFENGVPQSYQTVMFDRENLDSTLHDLGLTPAFFALDNLYDARPDWTDQESAVVFAWRDGRLKAVKVRAAFSAEDSLTSFAPAAFRRVYDRLRHFDHPGAVAWEPTSLRVRAWTYEHAPDDPPLDWPEGWPDLNSPGTTVDDQSDIGVPEVFTLRLPYRHRSHLDSLLMARGRRQAIRINGKKLSVGYEFAFPNDTVWTHHYARLLDW
jgi:hypothetical protein